MARSDGDQTTHYLADAMQKQRPSMGFAAERSLNKRELMYDGQGCELQIPTECWKNDRSIETQGINDSPTGSSQVANAN